jgi:SAM-dependent methyltransferase
MNPADLYGLGLGGDEPGLVLREADGSTGPVPIATWLGPLTPADHDVLARAAAPVLDVGCGPGRHGVALARRGVFATGVDVSPVAVEVARARGARVIHASVFTAIPGAGTWGTALLLDGNIGIGGQPVRLLARLRSLLRPGGEILAVLVARGTASRTASVRLEGAGGVSEWFPWARVGVDGIHAQAPLAGLQVTETWEGAGRWFARLAAAR